jgi:hypothetical protein
MVSTASSASHRCSRIASSASRTTSCGAILFNSRANFRESFRTDFSSALAQGRSLEHHGTSSARPLSEAPASATATGGSSGSFGAERCQGQAAEPLLTLSRSCTPLVSVHQSLHCRPPGSPIEIGSVWTYRARGGGEIFLGEAAKIGDERMPPHATEFVRSHPATA